MNQPILYFHKQNPTPYYVGETLAVDASGAVLYQSAAAAESARRKRAGSYAAQLNPELAAQAATLAERLALEPPDERAVYRQAIQFTVSARAGRETSTHALHRMPPGELPEAARQALELFAQLQQAAEAAPLAVVELSASLRQPPSGSLNPGQTRLMLQVHNPGTAPVVFKFQADSFQVAARGADGLQPVWQSGVERLRGFIDPEARLVDGIRLPAQLGAGQGAALLIPLALELPGELPLQVTAQGRIELLAPGQAASGEPRTEMALLCELAR